MRVIGLLPVRNEAWVLRHSLACLSAFCDVVLVCDQDSDDGSLAVYREFPKVVVLDRADARGASRLPRHGRWRLLDAARQYDGCNLLWSSDADEVPLPSSAQALIADARLSPGTRIDGRFYHAWDCPTRYRDDWSMYGPRFKEFAFVDDRIADYPRDTGDRPLHEPRLPGPFPRVIERPDLTVVHLQFAIWNRNQMKQAWYRCVERLDGREGAASINARYSVTLPSAYVRTRPLPDAWLREITLPDTSVDRERSWHESEILAWFDERGVEFFEPLEIWHIPRLRREFRARTGRRPSPDRSYRPPYRVRATSVARRIAYAGLRRIGIEHR